MFAYQEHFERLQTLQYRSPLIERFHTQRHVVGRIRHGWIESLDYSGDWRERTAAKRVSEFNCDGDFVEYRSGAGHRDAGNGLDLWFWLPHHTLSSMCFSESGYS